MNTISDEHLKDLIRESKVRGINPTIIDCLLELQTLRQKMEDGRLVELHAKAGERVYTFCKIGCERVVMEGKLGKPFIDNGEFSFPIYYFDQLETDGYIYSDLMRVCDFGKKWFLTREAAEGSLHE